LSYGSSRAKLFTKVSIVCALLSRTFAKVNSNRGYKKQSHRGRHRHTMAGAVAIAVPKNHHAWTRCATQERLPAKSSWAQ
jgi:hypothetical protein